MLYRNFLQVPKSVRFKILAIIYVYAISYPVSNFQSVLTWCYSFNYEIVRQGERSCTPISALPHRYTTPPPHGHHPYNAAHQIEIIHCKFYSGEIVFISISIPILPFLLTPHFSFSHLAWRSSLDIPSWPARLSLSLRGPLWLGSWTSSPATPSSQLRGHASTIATAHSNATLNLSHVQNNIALNVVHLDGSTVVATDPLISQAHGPAINENEIVTNQRGSESSAVVALDPLINQAHGPTTRENQVVPNRFGPQTSAVIASGPLTNHLRDPITRSSNVAMAQPHWESLTVEAWLQNIEWVSEPLCPSVNTSVTDTTLSSPDGPVTDPTIVQPDPDEEDQASNATTASEIDPNEWRRDFIVDILEWTGRSGWLNEQAILTMVQFLPDKRIAIRYLDAEQRRYERRCFSQVESVSESFLIFGRSETEQFDRPKCWVQCNLHLMQRHIWPNGYQPVSSPAELSQIEDDDDLSTSFDLEIVADSQAVSHIGWPDGRNSYNLKHDTLKLLSLMLLTWFLIAILSWPAHLIV